MIVRFFVVTADPMSDSNPNSEFQKSGVNPDRAPGHGHNETGETKSDENNFPETVGRFQIIRELGQGGFGVVYLAHDPELTREVAIKIPHREFAEDSLFCQRFREEGRNLAKINHAGVVSIYDVGTHENRPFVVMEYIRGRNLSHVLKNQSLDHSKVVEFLIEIAQALRETHKADIVHRDLKPGNIIIDDKGHAKVVDFGLALHDNSLIQEGRMVIGTKKYMAPEQIRGENHRTDGQTDIWAIGVTMYRMLTGKLPFDSQSESTLYQMICYGEPRPPRQRDDSISRELERICLKCLAKLMTDRYQSMADLLEDLHLYQVGKTKVVLPRPTKTPSSDGSSNTSSDSQQFGSSSAAIKIVPKGLRSFDRNDAEFFLELLPGPKDRNGLPESIRFWKSRTEGAAITEDFSVGMIYGPSGCGKSSFVRAGLIPRLDKRIIPVYVECTSTQTERQIVEQLARHLPTIEPGTELSKILLDIRCGRQLHPQDKVLIILDQFEQWLSLHNDFEDQSLVRAFRQCQSDRAQVILLCRDDFFMAASQFMRWLEIPIQEGVNAMALPLFDKRHARKVLLAFGRANDDLPPEEEPLSKPQREFVKQAVEMLAFRNRVICIRLAVLAEMMKQQSWSMAALNRTGGIEGVGVRFLDETFHGAEVATQYESYEEIARQILSHLLPSKLASIKGVGQKQEDLFGKVEGIVTKEKFDEVFEFLLNHAKLISPIELPSAKELSESGASTEHNASVSGYHLTHDFLVNPIREWIHQKEKENWRGRARIRFEELGQRWNETNDDKFLPSLPEHLRLIAGVRSSQRKTEFAKFWNRATKKFAISVAICLMFLSTAVFGLASVYHVVHQAQARNLTREALDCEPQAFQFALDRIRPYRHRVLNLLERKTDFENDRQRLHANLMQLEFGQENDERFEELAELIGSAEIAECKNIVNTVGRLPTLRRSQFIEATERKFSELETQLPEVTGDIELHKSNATYRNRIAIINFFLGDDRLAVSLTANLAKPSMRTRFIQTFREWHPSLVNLDIQKTQNPDLQYAICSALFLMGPKAHSNEEVASVGQWLTLINYQVDDAGVHNCSESAIRVWENLDGNESRKRTKFTNWFDHPTGLRFVRVSLTNPNRDLFVCDQEVPVGMMRWFRYHVRLMNFFGRKKFPTSTDYARISPSADHPAQRLGYEEAIMFCNWLSLLTDRKPCYLLDGADWKVDPTQSGFRLPSKSEQVLICKAGSAERHHFGDNSNIDCLVEYACMAHNSVYGGKQSTMKCRNLLPNRFGVYDSLGNVMEMVGPDRNQAAYLGDCYGGNYYSNADDFYSDPSDQWDEKTGLGSIGFRLITNTRSESDD